MKKAIYNCSSHTDTTKTFIEDTVHLLSLKGYDVLDVKITTSNNYTDVCILYDDRIPCPIEKNQALKCLDELYLKAIFATSTEYATPLYETIKKFLGED